MVNVINMDPNLITILLATACLFSGDAVRNERQTADDTGNTICYEGLGCFEKNGSLFGKPLFPLSPEKIGTQFRLFTQRTKDEKFQILSAVDVDSIQNSYFNPEKLTKIVVHGFNQDASADWIETMKNELLKAGDFNVLVVDWKKGSRIVYDQAAANTRVVGAEIARLITFLIEKFGANADDFHVIGHSLGAHIGGYAGERLPNLGRITGLDPAGPQFENKDTIVRLDPTDAKFVDTIHTDGKRLVLALGMLQPIGHVDYYPNGGFSQAGCSIFQGRKMHAMCTLGMWLHGFPCRSSETTYWNHQRQILPGHWQVRTVLHSPLSDKSVDRTFVEFSNGEREN
ncbi:hypothetical protein CHS0354_011083 [Potamilus streckersoni]|uniref:Lipase domain-containing protein n=1 Tax=Potamilus streckersoni TaxID=2493646 RepID=A0AAE0TMF6_9BIVA|nr:hypothetical protein CHS0354_011083 [Potamilus streckersoni]